MNKPQWQMRKLFAALAVSASVVTALAEGVTLTVDKVQQRYPWNGLVDIDYTISLAGGATLGPDENLEVTMIDRSVAPAVTNRAIRFLQVPLPMSQGSHRITWNANADGVTNYTANAEFHIKIVHYAAAYMVIDVSGGPTTNLYPVTFLNGEPGIGFNTDVYKGDKIVLRRIHPGSFVAGSPSGEYRHQDNEAQHRVVISKPFYIGIFEITQKQYENVMGEHENGYAGDYRPVEKVSYNDVRGGNWPSSATPADGSFMQVLLAKCKAKNPDTGEYTEPVAGFDLPTEAQWEYACRAGTTGAFNTTEYFANTSAGQTGALAKLGRYKGDQNDGKCGNWKEHVNAGCYLPNAWGLYDMHGNVWELCRDRYNVNCCVNEPGTDPYVDPKGPTTGSTYVGRGGCWAHSSADGCRAAKRGDDGGPDNVTDNRGFRLCRDLP